jgi:NDP-sugar pyrophosphorylase family protein
MTKIYDVDQSQLVEKAAEELKKIDALKMPTWANFVKTGVAKERPPIETDWWYKRAASILRKVYVFNFVDKNNGPKYWRDIGTRDAYYQASMDLVSLNPQFDLFDKSWPVRTYHEQYPPIKMTSTPAETGSMIDSLIAPGCLIQGARIERSILAPNVKIYERAEVKDSIIMERDRPALRLLQRLRDEAHRFGVTYHRLLRGKKLFA